MFLQDTQLARFLVEANLLTNTDVNALLKKATDSGASLSNTIISEGKMTEVDLRRAEAHVLGIPYVNLENEKIDFEVLSLITEPVARGHNIIAYKKTPAGLEVAMLDVDDFPTLDVIKKRLGINILPRLSDSESIKKALTQYKKSLQVEFKDIIAKEASSLKMVAESEGEISEEDLKKQADDLPIVRIVDTLVSHAIIQDASDIHIEPTDNSLIVRYRIDGILHDAMELPKNTAAGITARIKVLSNLKLDEKRLPQDGRFKITEDNSNTSFRVSTLPTYYGEKIVIRILRENQKGFSLEKLGFHGSALDIVHESMNYHVGMILATGPTGSGKTTTLYTMLDMLNTTEVNISTVEDPIEYQMPRINQTQVKPDIGMTFANGLRSLLRQDPNIVMVGEIRDGETAGLAINAALTGHLVLSTIHTNSASGAIPRLIDMGCEAFLLVSTLKTVISQRLIRRLTDKKEQYFLSEAEMHALSKIVDMDRLLKLLKDEKAVTEIATWDKIPFYRAVASDESPDGYKGRVGIHEVLKVSPTIKELILKGSSADEIEKVAKQEGMMTMLEDGIFLAVQGLTTTEEVLRVVSE
ncbi:MAG: type II/IV secretion system protein [Candidatus Pacebacteria bacterium]|nr:type II/IV secretion system protein [Candidatus Paceibacterota bacterium]